MSNSTIGGSELRQKIRALIKRDGLKCHYCGKKLSLRDDGLPLEYYRSLRILNEYQRLTLDHKKPISRGGTDRLYNLVIACASCNTRRGDMPYLKFLSFIRKEQNEN